MEKILVIEDDLELSKVLVEKLRASGYEAAHEADGTSGLERALNENFSVVLLDIKLPGMGGMEICTQLRSKMEHLGILLLTSQTEEIDRVLGLELGADDYVTKPFNVRELLARVKAVIRRTNCQCERQGKVVHFGDLAIDLEKRRLTVCGKPANLTSIEFDVLQFMAAHPGRPFTREELIEHVWGYQGECFEATITTHFSRLRAKVEPDPANPKYIRTVRGVGYRFAKREEI